MDDASLAAAAAQGSEEAFAALVERYRRYMYTIAYRILLNEDDALDAVQNALARVAQKIGSFDGRGAFRGWLAQISAREALNIVRHTSRRETPTDPQTIGDLVESRRGASQPEAVERLETAQRRHLVEEAMVCLSPQQRAILALQLSADMGPKEISEQLGLPARQVRVQIHRAIARIRSALGNPGTPNSSLANTGKDPATQGQAGAWRAQETRQ